jgi:hypothetical protein
MLILLGDSKMITPAKIKNIVSRALIEMKVKKTWKADDNVIYQLPAGDGKIMFFVPDDKNKKRRYAVQSSALGIWEGKLTIFKNDSNIKIGSPTMIMNSETVHKLFSNFSSQFSAVPTAMRVPAPVEGSGLLVEEDPIVFEEISVD